jgi:hypothetical protein
VRDDSDSIYNVQPACRDCNPQMFEEDDEE